MKTNNRKQIRHGNRITRFLESRGISWVAWDFDPDWDPVLLQSFVGFNLSGSVSFSSRRCIDPPRAM